MFTCRVTKNPHVGCNHQLQQDRRCGSTDRVANVWVQDGAMTVLNDPLCFSHRQNLVQVVRDAVHAYDNKKSLSLTGAAGMLTSFQQQYARGVELTPEFESWCLNPWEAFSGAESDLAPPRPKLFTYYTQDGALHADRVGQSRVLAQLTFPPAVEEDNK